MNQINSKSLFSIKTSIKKGVRAWFFHILTRTAWEYGKKKRREITEEEIIDYTKQSTEPSPSEVIVNKERASLIMGCIKELPIKQKLVIVLYYYNEFSMSILESQKREEAVYYGEYEFR